MKKTSLKGLRSITGKQKQNIDVNLKRAFIEEEYNFNMDSYSDLHVMEPLVEIQGGSMQGNNGATETENHAGTSPDKHLTFAKQPLNKPQTNKSRRKDKENYVFILIVNDSKESSYSEEPGESPMNVIDISSIITDKDSLLDNATIDNANFRPEDIKRAVEKVFGDLSKSMQSPISNPMEAIQNGHQYFLVLNCPIPFDVAGLQGTVPPHSKVSNKPSTLQPNKTKTSLRQQPFTENNTSPKRTVHKFKGGLTKRYLSDNSDKQMSVIDTSDNLDQNAMACDDDDSGENGNYFLNEQESDDEIPLLITSNKENSRKLRGGRKSIGVVKSKRNTKKRRIVKAKKSKKTYHCQRCVKSFNTIKLLKTHQKRSCCVNKKVPNSKKRAKVMLIQRRKPRGKASQEEDTADKERSLLFCDTCTGSFKTKRELRQHFKTVCNSHLAKKVANAESKTPGDSLICDVCGKMCRNRSSLSEHMAAHENLRQFECNECGKGFNKSGFLRKHIKTVHGSLRYFYFCSHCGLKSESKEHIERHEQVHTLPEGVPVPMPFQCSCGKAFISKHALRSHRHNSSKHFPGPTELKGKAACPVCAKLLSSVACLNMHMENKHNYPNTSRREKLFGCNQCEKKFARFGSFLHHKMEAHKEPGMEETPIFESPDAQVTCPLCQKVCRNRTALSAHKYFRHGGDGASAACEACGKTFKNRGSLLSHNYRMHRPPEVSRVQCDLCKKPFNDKNALWAHQKYVHSTDIAHCCGECGSKFKRKGDYTRHQRDKHGIPRDAPANLPEPVLAPYGHVVADPNVEADIGSFAFEVLHCGPL